MSRWTTNYCWKLYSDLFSRERNYIFRHCQKIIYIFLIMEMNRAEYDWNIKLRLKKAIITVVNKRICNVIPFRLILRIRLERIKNILMVGNSNENLEDQIAHVKFHQWSTTNWFVYCISSNSYRIDYSSRLQLVDSDSFAMSPCVITDVVWLRTVLKRLCKLSKVVGI